MYYNLNKVSLSRDGSYIDFSKWLKNKKQNIANLIDDESNQLSKNWVEINYESRITYIVNIQIKYKSTMLKSSLCDYSDAYILVKGNYCC